MPNLNKVMLMGNLTRDVELKSIQSGSQVAQFGLAINRKWAGSDGHTKEEVTFVDCSAWGKTAEAMAKYLAKGRPVFIEGRLKLDQWQDKQSGQNRAKLSVVVESFQFVDSKPGGQASVAPARTATQADDAGGGFNDDIPFALGDYLP